MTVENLHDAIGQLPSDLIAQVDKRRCGKGKVIPWQRITAMAACAAMILCGSWIFTQLAAPKGAMETAMDAAEAPAAAMIQENMIAEDAEPAETMPGSTARDTTTDAAPKEEAGPAGDSANASAATGHDHTPAEPYERSDDQGWCGNMEASISWNGLNYALSGTEAVLLTDILYSLPYSEENLCRCMAEFTAQTEMGSYEVNLIEYFARFEGKQAALTEDQAEQIREILNGHVIPSEIDN